MRRPARRRGERLPSLRSSLNSVANQVNMNVFRSDVAFEVRIKRSLSAVLPIEASPSFIPDVDDDFPKARAPLPIEQLESHARELAAEHRVTGGGGPRRELLDR